MGGHVTDFMEKTCPMDQKLNMERHIAHEKASKQAERLLLYLQKYGSISTLEARGMGIMHPSGRIMDLRRKGHDITTNWDRVGTTPGAITSVARYIYSWPEEVSV